MGVVCSTYGGQKRCTEGFWWENLSESDNVGDPGVGGKIILRWIFIKWVGGMDWIGLVQDRDRWRTVVKAVMNLRVP
jgi:hypothetical protein